MELVEILAQHPRARVVGLFGSGKAEQAGGAPPTYARTFGRFRDVLDLPVQAADPGVIASLKPDAVFLCTPHEASLSLAPKLVERGLVVLDLSAAFRLRDARAYEAYYGFTHDQPELLREAVYGMPEHFRERIARARLIAVPGCYTTASILPLRPLLAAGALRAGATPIIDATSGISGAGRKAETRLLYCEVSQQAYGVFKHRHQPEIDAYVGAGTIFTPHVGPYERGILATIHVPLAAGWTEAMVRATLQGAYGDEPFVRLCPPGVWPAVHDVRGTNFCDIALAADEQRRHLIICSALDNLVKGAAGQAVQCLNIRLGFDETAGMLAASGHAGVADR
jgi:N-acetyl-gamma-glutamyl-phosphate reductase